MLQDTSLAQKVQRIEAALGDMTGQIATELRKGADRDPAQLEQDIAALSVAKLDLTVLLGAVFAHGPPKIVHAPTAAECEAAQEDAFLRHAKLRLARWPVMLELIRRQSSHIPVPLSQIEEISPNAHMLLQNIYGALHSLANPKAQSDEAYENNCFADIPLKPWSFDQLMRKAHRVLLAQNRGRPASFVDVGCGGATKMLQALPYFATVEGLEYDAGYVDMARRTLGVLGHQQHRVHHANALLFEGYADYDVIYFYRPISDAETLIKMEDRIIDQAAPGTILIAPYGHFEAHKRHADCWELCDMIYVTGMSDTEISTLRKDISATGTDVITPDQTPPAELGYWGIVLEASRANGFTI